MQQASPPDFEDRFDDREDAPFLTAQDGPATAAHPHPSRHETTAFRDKLRLRLMITLFAIILFVETGNAMTQGPTTRIYESIACKRFYETTDASKIGPDGQVPEDLCKGSEIQGEVAIVKGYGELFDGVTSILLAIPYGLLADRIGRKPTIVLSIPGFILNMLISGVTLWFSNIFPLRAVWISALAWLFGGGLVVAAAMVWTMMADVTTEEQRSAIFFQFGVAIMASEFLSNSIGSFLMVYNPWYPMLLGWGITLLGIGFVLTLPETKNAFPSTSKPPAEQGHELSDLSTDDGDRDASDIGKPVEVVDKSPKSLGSRILSAIRTYSFLLGNKQALVLMSAFLVYKLSRGTAWFLVQYVSVRYGWRIATANLLVSLKSILMLFLFIAILPLGSWYLMKRRGLDGRLKDLVLTKASVASLLLGTLGMGLSPNVGIMIFFLVIQTLGAGFVYTTRSLVTTMIQRDQTARLYTMIEIIQALGMILASPTMTGFFKWGLQLGGFWQGLAWMVASVLFGIVGALIWSVKLPPSESRSDD